MEQFQHRTLLISNANVVIFIITVDFILNIWTRKGDAIKQESRDVVNTCKKGLRPGLVEIKSRKSLKVVEAKSRLRLKTSNSFKG